MKLGGLALFVLLGLVIVVSAFFIYIQYKPTIDQVLQGNAFDPNDVDALTGKGLALSNLERYNEAIVFYDKALAIEPNNADILNNKASALYELGHFDLANEIFDIVRKIIK